MEVNLFYVSATFFALAGVFIHMYFRVREAELRSAKAASDLERSQKENEILQRVFNNLREESTKAVDQYRDLINKIEARHMVNMQPEHFGSVEISDLKTLRRVLSGTHETFDNMPPEHKAHVISQLRSHIQSMNVFDDLEGQDERLQEIHDVGEAVRDALKEYDITVAMLKMRTVADYHPKLGLCHEELHNFRMEYLSTEPESKHRKQLEAQVDEIVKDFLT